MKAILLISLFIGLGLQVTVTDSDKCTACTDFKSQTDCANASNGLGCEWKNSACSQITTTPQVFLEYCQTLADPATKCAKTFGCAYVDTKCTHFTGCTAYVKTTLSDCQAISYQCITNGVTCDTVQLCKDYTKDVCETNPSPLSPYKCKLDGDTCRDMKCIEADASLATDSACDAWLDGCVTTGSGCIDVLPNCSSYTGTSDTCNKMIGKDGKCTLDASSTSSPQACKLRVCSEAALTTWDNTSCGNYKTGCKGTGFSCVDSLAACSSYTGTATTCLNFVGSDGQCAADAAATTCRARKCEDKVSGVLTDCTTYLPGGGCKTNGVTCVTSLGNCSTFKGTISTCAKYVGADGNCKGTSATDATVSCALKTCADDDQGTETTDTACQLVQKTCKTTGKGCVASLSSCTTYTDDGNCLKYVGLEGKCKAGAGGATPKCAARACADNTTATTNTDCQNYLPGCVTNGAGCVAEANCTDTVSKITCQGTTNNYTCGWTESCVVKDCTALTNQSLCANTKLSDSQPCIWKSPSCVLAACSDYTSTDNTVCDGYKKGCVSNGTKCADPANCATEFTGTVTTCRGYKATCTNTDAAAATDACAKKTCGDTNITVASDSDCDSYLTGCLFAGTNKCIINTSDCTGYAGASTDDCKGFTGYVSSTSRSPCWWQSGANCTTKVCSLAKSMTNDSDCGTFLTGCVYDGNGSCVDASSTCTHFKYASNASDCQALKGVNGTQKCYDGSSNACKVRACTDAPNTNDTDVKCDAFLTGCLTTGAGCIASTAACSSYSGTSVQCSGFKGSSLACQRTQACTTPASVCTNKTNATTNSQCVAYKATCVLGFGTTTCQDQAATCAGYTFAASAVAADKTTYCNQVQATGGVNCAYDSATTGTCVVRSCALWSSTLGIACTSYAGASSCSYANSVCYTPTTCSSHTIPSTVAAADKITYCNKFLDSNNKKCTFDSSVSATACKTMNKCEEAISPSVQDDCYDQTGQSNCVLIGTACITIKVNCALYDITAVTQANRTTFCPNLKANNSGFINVCKYNSGNYCDNDFCEAISSPAQQSDCDAKPGCRYYSSGCQTIKSCTSYSFPGAVTTDSQKLSFCQNMHDFGTTSFCSFTTGLTTCGAPKSCSEYNGLTAMAGGSNLTFCNTKRDKTGVVCTYADNATACSAATSTAICTLVASGISADSDCDLYTLPLACKKSGSACVARDACTAVTPSSATKLAECQALTGPDGFYCSFTASTCSVAADNCSSLNGTKLADCNIYINKHGVTCSWVTAATQCSDPVALTCEDAASPKSQADCDLLGTGCIFYNADCIKNAAACTSYDLTAGFADDAAKFTFCNGRVNSSGGLCTFTTGASNCVAVGACSSYTAAGATLTAKITYCASILTTDNFGCTYQTGANCSEVPDSCTAYTVTAAADCASLKDSMGRTCGGSTTTCAYPDCSTVSSPTGQSDCDAKMPGCVFYSTKCITVAACSTYTTGGSGAKAFCGGIKDTNGALCTADNDSDANCKARACGDTATQYFTTHKECSDYSPLCKSDGQGCVALSTACNSFNGDSTACPWFLDATGQGACAAAAAATDSQNCAAIACSMNVTAASQSDCDTFLAGGKCLWKNPGCYDSTVPCSEYRGTLAECSAFVGNSVKCFSDQATRGACRDRTCADKKTATSDDDCSSFLTGCVFNGVGCIVKTSDCTQFQGTSTTCNTFKGVSGTQLCWSGSTTVGPCKVRLCTQLTGTSDSDCEAFMPSSHCITNGTTCVVGPKTCSTFSGNDATCGAFTASDGPCKASSQSVSAVACTPKVCYEAPNTFTTDTQCQGYHPTCKTTGRGCQSTVLCGDYQNKTSCGVNNTCLWATSCRMTYTTCSSLTSQGQTVCVNNPAKKCAWFSGNGVSANAACRDYQCPDYDATLTTHDACQKASNNLCTTTGAGCVTYSTCATYTSSTMCAAAQTTETSKKCTWDAAKCRQQQCKDLKGTTDDDCNNQLAGCKSNGTTCIGPNFDCSVFNGSQKFCLIDSTGQPCLYVGGTCYSYDNCTDVASPTQAFCQTFSTNCVVGQTTCVALNQCSSYDKQVSCLIGISKSTCGWLPTQKCAEFKQCSDAAGTTWSDCMAWNSSCVSDGTGCVPLGDCASYLKQLSCENNYDTAQNACFWTGTACRQKQCSDVTATADADCVKNIVKESLCTTDGTKCVVRAACTAYGSQVACTVGSDGIPCFFGYAVGQTTGTQTCRAQECSDIAGATNDACVGKINKKPCVSNGKACVAQGTCASYKNKLSCAAGGSDNPQCVFTAVATATDPLAGTCVAFTACASANGDKVTCLTNKSCKYTDATNTCATTDCATYNGSGKCNPFPSFDGKTFTLCVTSASGCTAGDPTAIAQADCWATTRYTYTWNASTNKCASCKGSTPAANNSSSGNNSNGSTTTDSGYVLGASMVLALLGFMA